MTGSTVNSDNATYIFNSATTNSASITNESVITKSFCVLRKDKLDTNEIKDLLICVVYILQNISEGTTDISSINYSHNKL